jgi:hypothetical protein
MALVYISGQMVEDLKVVGKKTSYMEEVFTHGQMVGVTTESTLKIVNKDLVFTFGPMARNMKGTG